MKKKFSLEIKTPCHENFSKMTANENGSFCNSCAKNVIDLSTKTNSEVASFISNNKDKNICARMRTSQLEEEFVINETSAVNNLKYAVAVAASLLLTSNVLGQQKTPVTLEMNCPKPNGEIIGKVAYIQQESKSVSFIFKGKLLNQITKKPLSQKDFPHCTIIINGDFGEVNSDGDFAIPINISKNVQQLTIIINNDNLHLSKTLKIDFNLIKNGELFQNIFINPNEFENYKIMGGLGVNYIDTKKSNPFS